MKRVSDVSMHNGCLLHGMQTLGMLIIISSFSRYQLPTFSSNESCSLVSETILPSDTQAASPV